MENLKKIRIQNNLNQREMAKLLNISQVTYCGYENDKYQPSFSTLKSISKMFNVSIDYLIENEQFKNCLWNIYLNDKQENIIKLLLQLDEKSLTLAYIYCKGLFDAQNLKQ